MFDPTIGRWLTQDPEAFDAGDANLYRYCGNDPTNFVDPSGLQEVEVPRITPAMRPPPGAGAPITAASWPWSDMTWKQATEIVNANIAAGRALSWEEIHILMQIVNVRPDTFSNPAYIAYHAAVQRLLASQSRTMVLKTFYEYHRRVAELRARIRGLIKNLGHADYKEREKAQHEIMRLMQYIHLPYYRKIIMAEALADDGEEIRCRARNIINGIP